MYNNIKLNLKSTRNHKVDLSRIQFDRWQFIIYLFINLIIYFQNIFFFMTFISLHFPKFDVTFKHLNNIIVLTMMKV